jgi:hypothetical protein
MGINKGTNVNAFECGRRGRGCCLRLRLRLEVEYTGRSLMISTTIKMENIINRTSCSAGREITFRLNDLFAKGIGDRDRLFGSSGGCWRSIFGAGEKIWGVVLFLSFSLSSAGRSASAFGRGVDVKTWL